MPPVRVLVVDDSPSVCRVLAAHLRAAGMATAGVAHTGEAAVERVTADRPDVVTLDLAMPGRGGLWALDRVMAVRPTPVVLLSGAGGGAAADTLAGLARGAVDFLPKYVPGRDTTPAEFARELAAKVRTAAGVKVIRSLPPPEFAPVRPAIPDADPPAVLVVAASTGGPAAVRDLLAALPRPAPLGVLVVQHLPARFTPAFADLLARQTGHPVTEAADGDRLGPGVVRVAPGGVNATVGADVRIRLAAGPPGSGHRPSADVALESAARTLGRRAAGAVLTGMGDDGARGLAAVRAAGGWTFAQNEGSCVVYGMPHRAVQLGAAAEIDTPAGIGGRVAARFGTAGRGLPW